MKHIKLFGKFTKLNEVAGANIRSHIQNIALGEIHRFSSVGTFKNTATFPVATFAYMLDLSREVRDHIQSFQDESAKGIITNVLFPDPKDKSKFLVFYTNFDKAPEMFGKEQLIHEDEIFNNTDITTSSLKDIIDGWNRHS